VKDCRDFGFMNNIFMKLELYGLDTHFILKPPSGRTLSKMNLNNLPSQLPIREYLHIYSSTCVQFSTLTSPSPAQKSSPKFDKYVGCTFHCNSQNKKGTSTT
jgi:hypothetical protein